MTAHFDSSNHGSRRSQGRLQGSRALVTGGGSGMGLAIAERFLREGAQVAVADLNADALGGLTTEPEFADSLLTIRADTSVVSDIDAAVETVVAEFGGIDILVNNAGVFDRNFPCEELEEASWDRLMSINVRGYAFAMKSALRFMLPAGRGVIVNNCSISALVAAGGGAAYSASKGAILALNRQVAFEVGGRGVRVNAVAPGVVETGLVANSATILGSDPAGSPQQRKFHDQMTSTAVGRIPLGRAAKSDEIASVVAFLASADAAYITGECIVVDGGYVIS